LNNIQQVELKLLHQNYLDGVWDLPTYATEGAAAFDIIAAVDEPVIVHSFQTEFIPSGLSVWIKNPDYVLLLFPRSGKGCNSGIVLGNGTGVIDSDYQGEIKICVYNRTVDAFKIDPGEHIAQAILMEKHHCQFTVVDEFSNTTKRGEKGFGHSR
jgi:dUTP pyrophosphatase